MRLHLIFYCLTLPLLLFLSLQAKGQYRTAKEKRAFYLYVARHYLSDAAPVLETLSDTSFFTRFHQGETREDLLDGFNTLVHEAVHWYNYHKVPFRYENYYIAPGVDIRVRRQPVFNSVALNQVVPDSLETQIFRYRTYIGDSTRIGSQLNGFYGILEEFGAYYHGTKADLELYDFYRTFCTESACWVNDFLRNTTSTVHAYYEFRLFMAWYLNYAKTFHPEDYRKLVQDRNLRLAYTLLEQLFTDLVSEFFIVRRNLLGHLAEGGAEVYAEGDSIFIFYPEETTALRYDTFESELIGLKNLIGVEENRILEAFKLPGVSVENYTQFLE